MTKRVVLLGFILAAAFSPVRLAFAQSDRGTLTGTVSDSTGAVVPNVPVEAKNSVTGVAYQGATSTTGNYTISQLPAGNYEISLTAPGFKKYTRSGLTVEVAQVLRVDITLEVGASTESVTITAAATLLNTETGDVRHDIRTQTLDELPILGIGAGQAGSGGIRNPNAMVNLIPGTFYIANSEVRVNGAPDNTQSFRIEGQDASNTGTPGVASQNQPSVDAIQEIAIQTSNYAAEYGQAGGGVFNLTMKSGGNQFHGSAYEYFVNEDLNANQPFTGTPRPRNRRHDYGFTFGGPVWIPKIYNGRDKTFFFFNFEQFREALGINTQQETVPTTAYRAGDFSTAIPANAAPIGTLYPGGPNIFQGQIFDPTTSNTAPNGTVYRSPFPNNVIPASRFDPIAVKIQSLFPAPMNGGVVNNFIPNIPTTRVTEIPSVKLDQTVGANGRLSFFWQRTQTSAPISATFGQIDGLPDPLATNLGTFQNAPLYRLNYDHSLSPTLLLHLGAGYRSNYFFVPSVDEQGNVPNYDAEAQLGLKGGITKIFFPPFQNLCQGGTVNLCTGQGGMMNFGSAAYATNISQVPSFNASVTKVRANHTYKAGAEIRFEGYPGHVKANTSGTYGFSPNQTGPYATGSSVNANNPPGFAYASFLLGLVNNVSIANPIDPRLGKKVFGSYVQDSWKVTRTLTLDYGMRYDYATYLKEEHGRNPYFSPTTPNPALGGILGAVAFEGDGPGHCNCNLAKNYPWAFGPRLGVAYQFTPKTVFRSGFGVIYSSTQSNNNANTTIPSSASKSQTTASIGLPITTLSQGIAGVPSVYPAPWPNFSPSQFNPTGTPTTTGVPVFLDPNAGRPARQYQWSAGIQREILRDLVIDVSYIGNRGIWWYAPALTNINAINPASLAARGLDLNSATDRALLAGPLSAAASRGFTAPYPTFPASQSLAQALRPFPQFGTILDYWAPLGDTWYNALQVKVSKRLSHGLSFVSTFSKQKTLTIGTERDANPGTNGNALTNNVFNFNNNKYLSMFDQPLVFNISLTYVTPKVNFNKVASLVLRDWTVGAFLQYSSGLPIQAPYANNNLNTLLFDQIPGGPAGSGTFANRVPGAPLYTVDLNCHCYDPSKTFALNKDAWTDPPAGQFGTSAAYYNDYRTQRRPSENLNFGRTFTLGKSEHAPKLNVRAEFTNIFNRAFYNNPTATNAIAPQSRAPNGNAVSGFGFINTTTFSASTGPNILPRQGVLVARFTF